MVHRMGNINKGIQCENERNSTRGIEERREQLVERRKEVTRGNNVGIGKEVY